MQPIGLIKLIAYVFKDAGSMAKDRWGWERESYCNKLISHILNVKWIGIFVLRVHIIELSTI